jgi:hypothetical protein
MIHPELRQILRRLNLSENQRQDSTRDQLEDVLSVGTLMGCYDAVNFVRKILADIDKPLTMPTPKEKRK